MSIVDRRDDDECGGTTRHDQPQPTQTEVWRIGLPCRN
jgi:hypothetical protein